MRRLIAFLMRRKDTREPLPEDAARVMAALEALKAMKNSASHKPLGGA